MRHRVIAIDGPAASGKSSVARALAGRLGFAYVNSGAMYRAATWYVLQRGVDPRDASLVAAVAERARIVCAVNSKQSQIEIDGIDPAAHLHDEAVNQSVSIVSSVPRLREILSERMRAFSDEHDLVIEGRDIGSVVFPDTPFKFYIDASPEVRLQRRAAQGFLDEIAARDRADSSRATAPLVVARDAEVIDSSALTIDGVVDEIVRRLQAKGFQ
ncbi:MAG: (d)CMP kinase [Chthoniobacterales bacterium]|jgi:CMP/dCMP kinase